MKLNKRPKIVSGIFESEIIITPNKPTIICKSSISNKYVCKNDRPIDRQN